MASSGHAGAGCLTAAIRVMTRNLVRRVLRGRRRRRRRRAGRRCVLLLVEFELARTAQDAGAFIARAGAFGIDELRFDVVVVVVALHGKDSVRVAMADGALGFELGAAVVSDSAVNHEIAGTTFFAMLSVKDT